MHPILFNIGSFPVRSYGALILLAFLAALWLIRRRAAKFNINASKVTDLCFYALIVGILGCRVLFILQELPYYSKHMNEVFSLKFEGLTSFGYFVVGLPYIIWYGHRLGMRTGNLLDLLAPGFLLGAAIGRIGCFLNGCCYGRTCDVHVLGATHFLDAPGLHYPAQLYDTAMNLVAMGLVLLYERRAFRPGQGFGLAMMLHGLARFLYEIWRAGSDEDVRLGLASSTYWGHLPITEAQAVAVLVIAMGAVVWFVARRKQEKPLNGGAGNMPEVDAGSTSEAVAA